jgi:hypothetical protein
MCGANARVEMTAAPPVCPCHPVSLVSRVAMVRLCVHLRQRACLPTVIEGQKLHSHPSQLRYEAGSFADSSDSPPMTIMRHGRPSTFAMSINPLKLRKIFSRAAPYLASPRIAAVLRKFCGSAAWRGGGSHPKKQLLATPACVAVCPHRRPPARQIARFPLQRFSICQPGRVSRSPESSEGEGATRSDAAPCRFAQLCMVAIPYIDG